MGKSDTEIAMQETGKGEKLAYDPEFKGPLHNRKCTDLPCTILFVLFWIGMAVIAGIAAKHGDVGRLLLPTDSLGQKCGEGDLAGKTKLYFFDLTKCSFTGLTCTESYQVCVSECPTITAGNGFGLDFSDAICRYGVTPIDNTDLNEKVNEKACAPYIIKSISLLNRCIPDISDFQDLEFKFDDSDEEITNSGLKGALRKLASFLNAEDLGSQVLQDLENNWVFIIAGCAVALALAYAWVMVMRFFAGFMVWFSIITSLVVFAAAAGYTYAKWKDQKTKNEEDTTEVLFDTSKYQEYTYLTLAIISTVAFAVIFLMVLFLRTRIKIAIEIVRESSKAVSKMPLVIFFPIFTTVFIIILLIYWIWIAVFLVTSSDVEFQDQVSQAVCNVDYSVNSTCVFAGYSSKSVLRGFQIYHLLGLFWTLNLLTAIGQCTIAGAIATYYWTRDKSKIPMFPVAGALKRTLRYHLGSLIFGSLIIAIIQVIRVILEFIDRQIRASSDGEFAKFLMKCLKCCFWCLEKFIKILNKNAYIEIAVYGYSFCTAARKAFQLLARNVLRLMALDRVSAFLLFLGRVAVATVTGLIAYQFFTRKEADVNYYLLPVCVVVFFAYYIAKGFFNVFDMAIDTMFICFCEDSERNDGSEEKPYYMSENLKSILGASNDKQNEKAVGD